MSHPIPSPLASLLRPHRPRLLPRPLSLLIPSPSPSPFILGRPDLIVKVKSPALLLHVGVLGQHVGHPAQLLAILAQRELEVVDLDLRPAAVGRAQRGFVAGFDDEVGDDLVEGADRAGEGGWRIAEGVEEGFYCVMVVE